MMNDNNDEHAVRRKKRSLLSRLKALFKRAPKDREALMETLRYASSENIFSTEMLGMIERILQVSEMQVREVMVPKAQMVLIEKESQLDDILPIVIDSGHSRFPVMDPSDNDVVGILLAKDLLKYYFHRDRNTFNIADVIRPAMFTPQSKRLDALLREFRANRTHIAIVLDEYGHVAGLVTIEDVLEQIVGDIEDEYDIEEDGTYIKQLDDGSFIVKAETPIEEFNEYFHSHFNDDEFDTIGGIVLQNLGHLPDRGETIKLQNIRFKVLHSDNRRLYLLEVKTAKNKKSS